MDARAGLEAQGPAATAEEIKKAYKRQALRWHPDRCKPEDKCKAEEKFKEVSEAYETLHDPDRKVRVHACCAERALAPFALVLRLARRFLRLVGYAGDAPVGSYINEDGLAGTAQGCNFLLRPHYFPLGEFRCAATAGIESAQ